MEFILNKYVQDKAKDIAEFTGERDVLEAKIRMVLTEIFMTGFNTGEKSFREKVIRNLVGDE